ncbi:MAG: MFS transporter [Proteobacteria bacterium]|nr:MFS transporter [Pseudomonadota bacterium]
MSVLAEGAARPKAGIGAGVVTLLALAIFINYVDRGNLATAAPLMKDELHLSGAQLGLLFSAFFWTYTPSQILAGWLSERINAYRTLAIGLAIWSLATISTGFVSSFTALIALRLLLGLGESAAFPCSSKLIAQHLPAHRLGAANGAIGVGLALGPAFGTFVGGMAMAQWGWRTVFILFGLASLAWLLPWFFVTRDASQRPDESAHESAPAFLTILKTRAAWGACLGHFSANYGFYFVISWLPLYLVKARGFSVTQMSEIGGMIYLVYAASASMTGFVSDRWMQAGASSNRVRKTMIIASHSGVALAMLGCAFGGVSLSVACLFLAGASFGLGTPMIYAIAQTLAGPRAAGKWVGVQNCVGNIAGIVAPIVTGLVIDRTGQFFWAFAVACAVTASGILAWGVVIRRVEPVKWNPNSP